MRIRAVLAVALFGTLAACTGSITGGPGSGDTDDPADNMNATPAEPPDMMMDMTNPVVARAMLWVDAKVPYCQAPNHERDYDDACSATCERPDNPDWDPYRSDCSGFVSWAWGLPAPGRTTSTLAPYNTAVSHVIMADDLVPGDAINNDHHTMIFAEWIVKGTSAHFIEEPGCSADQPYARLITADVMTSAEMITILHRGTFTAIRHDGG